METHPKQATTNTDGDELRKLIDSFFAETSETDLSVKKLTLTESLVNFSTRVSKMDTQTLLDGFMKIHSCETLHGIHVNMPRREFVKLDLATIKDANILFRIDRLISEQLVFRGRDERKQRLYGRLNNIMEAQSMGILETCAAISGNYKLFSRKGKFPELELLPEVESHDGSLTIAMNWIKSVFEKNNQRLSNLYRDSQLFRFIVGLALIVAVIYLGFVAFNKYFPSAKAKIESFMGIKTEALKKSDAKTGTIKSVDSTDLKLDILIEHAKEIRFSQNPDMALSIDSLKQLAVTKAKANVKAKTDDKPVKKDKIRKSKDKKPKDKESVGEGQSNEKEGKSGFIKFENKSDLGLDSAKVK